jgi:type I restriction enzyme S subunit
MTYGTKMPRANSGQILNTPIVFAGLEEQYSSFFYLGREAEKIEALVMGAEIAIGWMQEYHMALISAAVIGKIDVRSE